MNITAKELSGLHLTSKITVPFEGQHITGTLVETNQKANIITEQAICEKEPRYGLGHQWVNVTLWGNFEETESLTITLNPNTTITIQEIQ